MASVAEMASNTDFSLFDEMKIHKSVLIKCHFFQICRSWVSMHWQRVKYGHDFTPIYPSSPAFRIFNR